jgi:purine catabolism regulator
LRHNHAEIVWPVANGSEATEIATTLFDDLTRRLPDGSGFAVSMGAGRVRGGPTGIRQSHQEARQALTMGRRLHGPGRLTRFDDLGVYRLLFAAQGLPELRAFHDEALGPLVAYDRDHGAELIRTLEAFFAARCGPKEAAALLGVHRNTVLYRLDRVRELTGLDLDDADVRLRLHLALAANAALYGEGE